ncbi:MAG: PEGA domain-containing protein [Deltaproteobacteria bacterium]|nr:PEGA domain-containing protein [Deltaproteobacteria bacterium]
MRFSSLLLLISSVCVGLASAALPSSVVAQASDVNAEARVFFERGNRSFADAMRHRGRAQERGLEQALEAYVSSLRIVRSRNALFNAAAVLEQLNRLDEAFAYYREYLDIQGLSDADRRACEEKMTALRPRVAVVRVRSSPPGASVRVDRLDLAPRGRTPLELALPPGEHTFYLSLEHYDDARATATASLGQVEQLAPTLSATPRALSLTLPGQARVLVDGEPVGPDTRITPGHHRLRYEPTEGEASEVEVDVAVGDGAFQYTFESTLGTLRVLSSADARVSLDGRELGRGADVSATASGGAHVLVVSAPGHHSVRRDVELRAGETLRIEVELVAVTVTRRRNHAAIWTGVASLVSASVFAGVAYAARQKRDAFDSYVSEQCPAGCPDDPQAASRADTVDRYNRAADAILVITGALAVTSVILAVTGIGREELGDAALAVAPLPGGAMAVARFSLEAL